MGSWGIDGAEGVFATHLLPGKPLKSHLFPVARRVLRRRSMRLFFLLATIVLVSGCSARGPAISAETDSRDAIARRGEAIFRDNCNVCHPSGGKGLGPALDRSLARESAITQVRDGFGLMPGFSADKLSDADVDAVLVYVDALVARAEIARAAETQARADAAASSVILLVDSLGWDSPQTLTAP